MGKRICRRLRRRRWGAPPREGAMAELDREEEEGEEGLQEEELRVQTSASGSRRGDWLDIENDIVGREAALESGWRAGIGHS